MSERDPAMPRWAAIQLVRIVGAACAVVGILIVSRRLGALTGLPEWLGYPLIAAGMIGVFLVPTWLARRWRTPPR